MNDNGYGEKGQFCWLSKHVLQVDDSYQRMARSTKVRRMASSWRWSKCGTLEVSKRGEHSYFVVDGQHRKCAADTLDDVNELPCMVYRMRTVSEEADNFVSGQKDRTNLSAYDQFRAKLIAGDEIACRVNAMLSTTGHSVVENNRLGKKSEYKVSCIETLQNEMRKDIRANREPVLESGLWTLIDQICRHCPPHNRMVTGICALERALRRTGDSLTRSPHKGKLIELGHETILRGMADATEFLEDKSAKGLAAGIVKLLNKGRRSNRISLNDIAI